MAKPKNNIKNALVKQSKIQGTGVFATKRFRAGQEILAFDDSHIVEDESTVTRASVCSWGNC
jgi:hypothetical protein